MTAAPEVIAAALEYRQRGYNIVAARPNKAPWGDEADGKNWRRPFSTQEITDRLQGRLCNGIGFLGGEFNNGIVPLDFDTEEGEAWWRTKCEAAGVDPDDFPTVITPGKVKDGKRTPGKHRYVSDTRGTLGNSEGALKLLGINIRGNGHAMLPPSPHPDGGTYQWIERHSLDDFEAIPACPDFVYEAIEAPRKKAEQPHSNGAARTDDGVYRYCRAALEGEREELARTKSDRNIRLNDAALKLGSLYIHGAFTESEARTALEGACEQNGYIAEHDSRAFEATFESGWKAGLVSPRKIEDRDDYSGRSKPRKTETAATPRQAPSEGESPDLRGMLLFSGINEASITDRLVKALIGEESLAVIAGAAGSGKTFLALLLAICVAMAREFFGRKTIECGVLYVGAEGQAGLKKRIKAWKIHNGFETSEDVPFALYPAPIDLVTDPKGADAIIERVELLKTMWPDVTTWLVVIDTLARCFGSGDESATQDMNTFVTRCDTIRNACKAAVLIVHHFGKDESKGMRGSVALKAAADTVIEVIGTTGTRTARVEKQKDGETGEQFTFMLKPVEIGTDDDGAPVTSCVVEPAGAPPVANTALSRNQSTMLSILADAGKGGLTADEWNGRARDAGLGTKRRSDLYDLRRALKARKSIYEWEGKWFIQA